MNDIQSNFVQGNVATPNEVELSTFGPKELLATILANWLSLLAFIAVGAVIAAAYLYVARPVYQAEAIVLFESKNNEMSMILGEGGAGARVFGAGQIEAEIAIIKSQLVLNPVVQSLRADVIVTPRYFPVVGEPLARRDSVLGRLAVKMPGLRRYIWSHVAVDVPTLDVPQAYEGVSFAVNTHGKGSYNLLLGEKVLLLGAKVGQPAVAVLDAEKGETVKIFVSQLDAPTGANFIVRKVKLAKAAASLRGRLDIRQAGVSGGVLKIGAMGTDGAQAAKTANAVANAYVRQNVERRSAEAAQTLAFLKSQLPIVRDKLEAAEGDLNTYRLRNSSADLGKETEIVLTESATVENRRNEVLQKRAELLLTLTPAHPSVKALDIEQAQLSDRSARVQKSIAKLPETEQELLRLRREVEVNTALYTTMLNNMQQLEVAEAGTLGNARFIDEAQAPGGPVKPKPFVVMVGGILAGLALGLVVLVVRRLMDHAEHDPIIIEKLTGLPIYATVPFSREQTKLADISDKMSVTRLLVLSNTSDPAAESIRSLRTTLHFSVFESKNKSIMFTGPAPGIGKSFVTSNLSVALAQTPMKVVLIDADLRRGTVHKYFGLERGKGLSNYILGDSILDVMQESGVDGLKVITTGDIPPNPSELLMSPRFQQLLAEAEQHADMVLVDSGPVLAVTDASIIGRVTGTTLMLLKAGQHTRREIQDTVKRLAQVNVRVRGIVLNQVGKSTHYGNYGYYGYGKYGYYYSYGYKNKNK